MTYQNHSKFPWKKCFIASVVILIIASLILVLLLSITKSVGNDRVGRILLIVVLSACGGLLVGYWIYQVVHHIRVVQDENGKENR